MSFRLAFITLPLVVGAGLMTGGCGVPVVVAGASYAADGGLLAASDKTSGDHMISMVSKQDCALWRVIKGRAVCKPREGDTDPYKVNYDEPQRMVAEDGVHYTSPLLLRLQRSRRSPSPTRSRSLHRVRRRLLPEQEGFEVVERLEAHGVARLD